MKRIIIASLLLVVMYGCEKSTEMPPGEAQMCVECQNEQYLHFDTCATLDACNQWVKKHNYVDCYYTLQP